MNFTKFNHYNLVCQIPSWELHKVIEASNQTAIRLLWYLIN